MSGAIKKINSSISLRNLPEWNQRILVIDDEVSIAESIQSILVPPERKSILGHRKSSRSKAIDNVPDTESGSRSGLKNISISNGEPTKDGATADVGAQITAGSVQEGVNPKYEVTMVHNPKEALRAIEIAIQEGRPYAMGFFDIMLNAEIDGIELVKKVMEIDSKIQAVFVTAYSDRSVDSINNYLGQDNASRWDYVNKPFTEGEIVQKARNVVSLWNLREQKNFLDDKIAESQKWLLDAEKAQTVAAVSRSFVHEFGNIMTQILGHCELALMKNDTQRMKEALEVILRASESATSILNKFKNVSSHTFAHNRIEKNSGETDLSNSKDVSPQLLNISQLVNDALELMKFQFKKNNVHFQKNEFQTHLIEGFKNSLFQVFMNIFINAVHSMSNGGLVEVSLKKENENIRILIRDHGDGIDPHLIDHLFEPMFSTKGEKGTGLGLSICKEIIEIEHQGEIKIYNHSEKGAIVDILLPLRLERIEF